MPSEEQMALDAEVERRKAAKPLREPEPPPVRPIADAETALQIAGVFKLRVLTVEEIERAEELSRQESALAISQLEKAQMEGVWKNICPDEFRADFDFGLCKAKRATVERALNWQFQKRGLFLIGKSGKAKTRAVWALLKKLYLADQIKPTVFTGAKFANEAASAAANTERTQPWIDRLAKCKLLVIDDLGKKWTKSTEEAFFDILDQRTAWHRPTIITSNYDADELQSMSFARGESAVAQDMATTIFRRIHDYLEIVNFDE